MPKIPQYSSGASIKKVGIQAGAPAPRVDPSSFTQTSRAMSQLGVSISSLADVANTISNVKADQEFAQSKIQGINELETLKRDSLNDNDFQNIETKYSKAIKDTRERISKTIRNPLAKKQFQNDYDLKSTYAFNDIMANGRKRFFAYDKDLMAQEVVKSKDSYYSTTDPNKRANIEAELASIYDRRVKNNVLTKPEAALLYNKSLSDLAEGQAKYDTYNNPNYAISELSKGDKGIYKGLDRDTRLNLMKEAEALSKKRVQEIDVNKTRNQFDFQKEFEINLDNLPVSEALEALDNGKETGTFNDKWADAKRKAILTSVGINQDKMDEFEYDIIMQTADVTQGYTGIEKKKRKSKNAKEYLRQIHDIEVKINEGIASGLMDKATAKKHLLKIYNSTTAEATQKAITGKPFIYDIKDADNFFKKVLSQGDRYGAVRNFFNETDGKRLNRKEQSKIASDIAEDILKANRNEVLKDNDLKIESETKYNIKVGTVDGGYRYKGGDPANPNSWEKAE